MQSKDSRFPVPGRLPERAIQGELKVYKFRHVSGIHYFEAAQLADGSSLLRLEQRMVVPSSVRWSYQIFDPDSRMERLILLVCKEGSVWATRRPLDEFDWKKAIGIARRLTNGGRRRIILPSRPEFSLEEFAARADNVEAGMIFVPDRTAP